MATLRQILKLSLLEAQAKEKEDALKAKEAAKRARRFLPPHVLQGPPQQPQH